jgi:hypothetical protein
MKHFLALAEELNFGHAAQRPHMAQPPLTRQIRGTERARKRTLRADLGLSGQFDVGIFGSGVLDVIQRLLATCLAWIGAQAAATARPRAASPA